MPLVLHSVLLVSVHLVVDPVVRIVSVAFSVVACFVVVIIIILIVDVSVSVFVCQQCLFQCHLLSFLLVCTFFGLCVTS